MTDDPARERLDQAVRALGVPYELFACDPALADTAAFCAAYGFAMGDAANTILVVGKSEPRQYAACIVLATHRLDVNRAVRAKFARGKASFAGPDETPEMTGMEIGGVTPFGLPASLPIWVDAAVMGRPRSSSEGAVVRGRYSRHRKSWCGSRTSKSSRASRHPRRRRPPRWGLPSRPEASGSGSEVPHRLSGR